MKIKIDLKLFIFLIVFLITNQIKIYALLMIFAFIHEIGHLIAGLLLKFKPESLKIAPYGFQINFNIDYEDYNYKIKNANKLGLKRLIIALAGPLTNLALAIIFYLYYLLTKNVLIFNFSIELIIYSNILIMLFNLIPIYPMDGGRIIKEITYMSKGLVDSYIITNRISNITIIILTIISSLLILFYKNIAIIIVIGYLWILNIKRNHLYNLKMKLKDNII